MFKKLTFHYPCILCASIQSLAQPHSLNPMFKKSKNDYTWNNETKEAIKRGDTEDYQSFQDKSAGNTHKSFSPACKTEAV